MHRFPGIEAYLQKGYVLEVSAVRNERNVSGFWVAQLTRRDGRTMGPPGSPELHLMLSIIELEHAITKTRVPPFRRSRHADSPALMLLRHTNVSITVSFRKETYSAHIFDTALQIPGMSVGAASPITALLELITLILSSFAGAHHAKFLGH